MTSALILDLLSILSILVLIPAIVLFVEVAAAVLGSEMPPALSGTRPRSTAVLVPAHNEEATIARTIRSIAPQLTQRDHLLVVADNCTDNTVEVARSEGAKVVRRENLELRGKGYALDYGVRYLEKSDPPDVVIIIDADCVVEPGSIALLATTAVAFRRPVQASDRMRAPGPAGLRMRIAEFAWLIKTQVRPLGLHRMGLPCQLMGTGMAFPWTCIRTAPLATGHIVEDLKLGIELVRRGHPPLFCPQAAVSSEFPLSSEAIRVQRTRWEHGHLRSILNEAPKLLIESLVSRDAMRMVVALDLSVPPLALLAMSIACCWVGSVLTMTITGTYLPLLVTTASSILLTAAVLISWRSFGKATVSALDLVLACVYAVCKLPLYLRFLFRPQSRWVRSSREQSPTRTGTR